MSVRRKISNKNEEAIYWHPAGRNKLYIGPWRIRQTGTGAVRERNVRLKFNGKFLYLDFANYFYSRRDSKSYWKVRMELTSGKTITESRFVEEEGKFTAALRKKIFAKIRVFALEHTDRKFAKVHQKFKT